MADLVCVATRTAGGGLFLRWYRSVEAYGWRQEIATATAAGYRLHGWVQGIPPVVREDAARCYQLLMLGHPEHVGQALAHVTHEVRRMLGWRRLVPVRQVGALALDQIIEILLRDGEGRG